MSGADRWEWCAFRTLTADGARYRWGSAWRSWGIHAIGRDRFVVTHIPTGRRLTEFGRLAIARRFCELADELAEWNTPDPPPIGDAIWFRLHRLALRVSGAKPALRALDGGAP